MFWSGYNSIINSRLKKCIHFFLDDKSHSFKRKNNEIDKEQLKNVNIKHRKSNDTNYINKSNNSNKNNKIQNGIVIFGS